VVVQQSQKARPRRLRLRDQYNQLSLFTDVLVPSAIEQAGVGDDRTDTARREDSQSLAGGLSANGERTGDEESPGGGADRGAGTDGRPSLRAGFSAKAGLSGGVGAGGEGVGVAPEREPRSAILAEEVGPEPEPAPARDFRINSAHGIGEGILREKALANLQATRTLKLTEAETRDANETEKAQLARYTGWGALANVFKRFPPQEWQGVADQLRELLTDDEYEAARASTPNAIEGSRICAPLARKGFEETKLPDVLTVFGQAPKAFVEDIKKVKHNTRLLSDVFPIDTWAAVNSTASLSGVVAENSRKRTLRLYPADFTRIFMK
jgi:hypothetical protein